MTDIPRSFTASVDRPFDPVSIRLLTTQLFDRNNQRLSDAQVQEMITNPPPAPNPNARIEQLTMDANQQAADANAKQLVYNLSLKDIATRLSDTVHAILDDLVNFNRADGIQGFLNIFIQSDRLIFVGMILLMITVAAMIFKTGDDASVSRKVFSNGGGCCGGCSCSK